MGCSNCKKKKVISKETKREFRTVDTMAGIIIFLTFLFALYGLYHFIIFLFTGKL